MKIRYETGTCGRCGGSGEYSYCQMHGTTCFGCNGSGSAPTKAGKAAVKRVAAFKKAKFSKLASAVKAGDIVNHCNDRFIATVDAGFTPLSGSVTDGECIGSVVLKARKMTYHISPHSLVVAYSVDEFRSVIVPYAAKLAGATVID